MPARELACAALGWALAIAVWIAAGRIPRSFLSDPFGAEGMPRGLAAILAVVSSLIAVRALIAWRAGTGPAAPVEWGRAAREHAKAFGIVALGFGYVSLATWLGYTVTAALLIVAVALYYGAAPSLRLAAIALAGGVFFWWLFARVLSVSMPAGFWPKLLG